MQFGILSIFPMMTFAAGQCSVARVEYSGSSFIDIGGNWTQKHNKILNRSCPSAPSPYLSEQDVQGMNIFQVVNPRIPLRDLGYCWAPDPRCCNPCPSTLSPVGNYATNNILDGVEGLLYWNADSGFHAVDETHGVANGTSNIDLTAYMAQQVLNFPTGDVNGLIAFWILLQTTANYSMELTEQVTDAEAESAQTVIVATSRIAEFLHDYTRTRGSAPNIIFSRYTSVAFTLSASNLVAGKNYIMSVQWKYSTGLVVNQSYPFVASAKTQSITDFLPTPAQGVTIEVRSPSIRYA